MIPELVNRDPIRVIGMPITFEEANPPDFKAYWERFMARSDEISPMSVVPGAFAVDYHPDQSEESEGVMYVPGMAVSCDAKPPEGMIARDVPGGLYAAFVCQLDTIQPTYEAIEAWLENSEYAREMNRPGIEQYHSPWEPQRKVTIYVPLKNRK